MWSFSTAMNQVYIPSVMSLLEHISMYESFISSSIIPCCGGEFSALWSGKGRVSHFGTAGKKGEKDERQREREGERARALWLISAVICSLPHLLTSLSPSLTDFPSIKAQPSPGWAAVERRTIYQPVSSCCLLFLPASLPGCPKPTRKADGGVPALQPPGSSSNHRHTHAHVNMHGRTHTLMNTAR